jgi:response regulator RpfG family c-di-GMP phosphodiesterase
MPGRTGYEICQYLKMSPRHRHVRVLLTAGVLEELDEDLSRRVSADGTLKKPFEATALLAAVKPLAEAAVKDRTPKTGDQGPGARDRGRAPAAPFVAVIDAEQVRAAVTVALDAAMENMVEEITRRVVAALQSSQPAVVESAPRLSLPEPAAPSSPPLPETHPVMETVRRVSSLRVRSNSILGLDIQSDSPATR